MDVDAVRRMWTFRAYAWGLRCVLVAFLLIVPAGLWPRWFGSPAVVLAVVGIALGIPLRVQAFWRLDVPYITLFVLGLNDALPPFLRSKPSAFRNPAGLNVSRRSGLLEPMAPPGPAQRAAAEPDKLADVPDKLADVRASGSYRLSVWGYRIMLLSMVGCCSGIIADDAPWMVLVPAAALLGGFLLTFPLRHDSQVRLWLSPGRILTQQLRDMFNPTFR